jgi:hypothetical protein
LEVVGEVVHVRNITFELRYVAVRGVVGLLFLFWAFFLFYFIIGFRYFLFLNLFLGVILFDLRIIMQTSILDREYIVRYRSGVSAFCSRNMNNISTIDPRNHMTRSKSMESK